MKDNLKVAFLKEKCLEYNQNAPFHPSVKYPEYPFEQIGTTKNCAYDGVREIFRVLGMDMENYGTKLWNPLKDLVTPGEKVLIKPNLVRNFILDNSEMNQLVTHGSIIRAILDFVCIALDGTGNVTIGDSPLQSADFEKLVYITGINSIRDFYHENSDLKIDIVDFRMEKCVSDNGFLLKQKADGDPLGYIITDLRENSDFFDSDIDYKKFRVTNYDRNEMLKHHNKINHEYAISKTALDANLIINLPKLKTHRKAGITCSLKNMIGINCAKDYLPHHMTGSIEEGGDEYLKRDIKKKFISILNEKMDKESNKHFFRFYKFTRAFLVRLFNYKDPYFEGSWYGNHTIPRTISDINKIVYYADTNGILKDEIQRKIFILADGIIAGEKEGPLESTAKKCGLLIAGFNPVAVDVISCGLMGFDYKKIPQIQYALKTSKFKVFDEKISAIKLISKGRSYTFKDICEKFNLNFIPPEGWKGHIEYKK